MALTRITNRSRRYVIPEGLLIRDAELLDHFMDDVIFVSIDFEGEDNYFDEPGIIRPVSVGISVLDIRDLGTKLSETIPTQNLCFMSPRQFKETNKHFLFGASEELPFVTTKEALRSKLSSFLNQQDPEDANGPRKVVLVTFDGRGEAVIMDHLGVRFDDLPFLVGILDVQDVIKRVLGMPLGKRPDELWSFTEALEACKISYGNLHVGGNDAYFNLQLLFSLTSIECKRQEISLTDAERHKLSLIQNLSANALQVDRSSIAACFEYKGEMNWRSKGFRKRALKYIRNSRPEVQEARRQAHLAELERRKEVKENNEDRYDKFEGIKGFSEVFDWFGSE